MNTTIQRGSQAIFTAEMCMNTSIMCTSMSTNYVWPPVCTARIWKGRRKWAGSTKQNRLGGQRSVFLEKVGLWGWIPEESWKRSSLCLPPHSAAGRNKLGFDSLLPPSLHVAFKDILKICLPAQRCQLTQRTEESQIKVDGAAFWSLSAALKWSHNTVFSLSSVGSS